MEENYFSWKKTTLQGRKLLYREENYFKGKESEFTLPR